VYKKCTTKASESPRRRTLEREVCGWVFFFKREGFALPHLVILYRCRLLTILVCFQYVRLTSNASKFRQNWRDKLHLLVSGVYLYWSSISNDLHIHCTPQSYSSQVCYQHTPPQHNIHVSKVHCGSALAPEPLSLIVALFFASPEVVYKSRLDSSLHFDTGNT